MSEERTITESRDVSGFDGVALGGYGTVVITQGDRSALSIEAAEDVMPRITSKVKDGVLVLGIKRDGWLKGLRQKGSSIRFNVTMERIRKLALSGSGRIDSPGIDTDALAVTVSGAGAVEIASLKAASLNVVLSGAGNCGVAGRVTTQSIVLSGAGNYSAPELESETATAVVSGAGNVTIHVEETLDAKVSGVGSVRYHGAPTIRQRVTGVGSVKCTCSE